MQYAAGDDSSDDDAPPGQHLGSATAAYSLQLLPGEKVLQVGWAGGRAAGRAGQAGCPAQPGAPPGTSHGNMRQQQQGSALRRLAVQLARKAAQ
jgi:hypothetical protein